MPPTPGSSEMGQAIMGAQQAALFMELESLHTTVKLLEQKVKDLEEEKYQNQNLRNETDQLKDKTDKLYAMDHDPEVELQKMLKFGPVIKCDLIPMLKKMMTLDHASTVIVCFVPPHASDDDIKESFSYYGDIISVEMHRMDKFQAAYVTYKDREDAKLVVSVEKAKVCNQEVRVLSQRYYQAPADSEYESKYIPMVKPSEYESKYIPMVKPSKENTEECFRNMREKALKKYKDLIKCHAELQVTDGKAASGGTDSIMKNDVDEVSTMHSMGITKDIKATSGAMAVFESEIFQPRAISEARDVNSASGVSPMPSQRNAKHIEAGSSGGSVDEMSR